MITANKNMMTNEESRKKLDRIQTTFVLIVAIPMFWAIWQFKKGQMSKDESLLWIALPLFPAFLMDAYFSLMSGITWAKGIKISRESMPNLFRINVASSIVFAGLCLIYALWYWTK
jgi:hypothetical protein